MKYLVISCLILCQVICLAQNAMTLTDFLASAHEQPTVVFQKQKVNFLDRYSQDLPFIEQLEFRTETNNFDLRKQEFLLRVTPNSLANIKTQRQHQESVRYTASVEQEAALGKALRSRYDLIVKYIYLQEILEIKEKQKVLLNDRVTLMQRSIALPNFDILDLIQAEDEAEENTQDMLDITNAIRTTARTIQRMDETGRMPEVEKEKLIELADVKARLIEQKPTQSFDHPMLNVISSNKYQAMLEYEWEAAQSKFSLGYVQAKYGHDPEDSFRESFSIGVGFEIPLRNSERLDLNELQVKVFESESRYQQTQEYFIENQHEQYGQLNNMIQKYDLVVDQLENSQAEFALEEYSKIAEASPNALLKLRENTLRKELLLHRLKLDIMQTYIEYLDNLGLLAQQPYRNYLMKEMVIF